MHGVDAPNLLRIGHGALLMERRLKKVPRYNETSRSRLLWLRITTSAVFILLIIYFSDVSEVFSNISEANMGWLGVAIIFQFIGNKTR